MAHTPFVSLFIGAPGSGKGTQTTLAAEAFHLSRLEMSKLLESRFAAAYPGDTLTIRGKDYSLAEQEKLFREGFLVEAPVVSHILAEKLQEAISQGKNVVLDGFPRTIEQFEYLLPFLEEHLGKERLVVVYLEVGEEESLKRNSQRRICELMRHPILFVTETANLTVCPLDGSRLVKRVLDDPEVIRVRLQTFQKETMPVIDYMEAKNVAVHHVQADLSVAEVFSQVSEVMKSMMASA